MQGITQPPAPANGFKAIFQSLSVAQEECNDFAGNQICCVNHNKPAVAKPVVPAHSVVVVGTLSTVTFCAFASRSRTAMRSNFLESKLLIQSSSFCSGRFLSARTLVIPRKGGRVINRPCLRQRRDEHACASAARSRGSPLPPKERWTAD